MTKYNELNLGTNLYFRGIEFFRGNNIDFEKIDILFYFLNKEINNDCLYLTFKYKDFIYYAYIGGKYATGVLDKKVKMLDFMKRLLK